MISVEKSKASDKKTSTESESKENEKVSKPDEFNAEEAITPTPDGLGESDQANRLPGFNNPVSQPISPVSSRGSEKSSDPAIAENGGELNSLASFQGSEETPSSKETELGGQTIKQTLNVNASLADVSKLSTEELLLRELDRKVETATCLQDVSEAMTGQPFNSIGMWKVLRLVMPSDALSKYKGDVLRTEDAERILMRFGNRETVQIPTTCLKQLSSLERTLEEVMTQKVTRQVAQYGRIQLDPSLRVVNAWLLTSLSICWIDAQFVVELQTLAYQCLYPLVTDLTEEDGQETDSLGSEEQSNHSDSDEDRRHNLTKNRELELTNFMSDSEYFRPTDSAISDEAYAEICQLFNALLVKRNLNQHLVTIGQLQSNSSTGNDSINDTTEVAEALGELFDLFEGFKMAYVKMKMEHLNTYGSKTHERCFGNIFSDDSYVTWTVIMESFTKKELHRDWLKYFLGPDVPYNREAWSSPVNHPKQCERPGCPMFSPFQHHCSIDCEERHQEQIRKSRALDERKLQESIAQDAFQKQACQTTWGTTETGGFSEQNFIVMNQQVAEVTKALTKDAVSLNEILGLVGIPCKSGTKGSKHKHKSSCLHKALSRLLKLFCKQVASDLTEKKKMPKTGLGKSQDRAMLSLLIAKITMVARGFYSVGVLTQEDDLYMSLFEHVEEDEQLTLEAVSRNISFWNDQLKIALEGYEQSMKPRPKRPTKYVSDSESDGEHDEDNESPTPGGGGDGSPSDSSSDDDTSHSDNSEPGGGSSEEDEEDSENDDYEDGPSPSDKPNDNSDSDSGRPPKKRSKGGNRSKQSLFTRSTDSGGMTVVLLSMTDVEYADRIVGQSKDDLNRHLSEQTLMGYSKDFKRHSTEQFVHLAIGVIDLKEFHTITRRLVDTALNKNDARAQRMIFQMSIKSVFQYNREMLKEWVDTFGHDGLLLIWLTDDQVNDLIARSYEKHPDTKKYVISNKIARKQIRNLKSICKSARTRWRPVIDRMFANVKEEYYFAWEQLEQQGDFVPQAIKFVIGLIEEKSKSSQQVDRSASFKAYRDMSKAMKSVTNNMLVLIQKWIRVTQRAIADGVPGLLDPLISASAFVDCILRFVNKELPKAEASHAELTRDGVLMRRTVGGGLCEMHPMEATLYVLKSYQGVLNEYNATDKQKLRVSVVNPSTGVPTMVLVGPWQYLFLRMTQLENNNIFADARFRASDKFDSAGGQLKKEHQAKDKRDGKSPKSSNKSKQTKNPKWLEKSGSLMVKKVSEGDRNCFNCGGEDHYARDCTNKATEKGAQCLQDYRDARAAFHKSRKEGVKYLKKIGKERTISMVKHVKSHDKPADEDSTNSAQVKAASVSKKTLEDKYTPETEKKARQGWKDREQRMSELEDQSEKEVERLQKRIEAVRLNQKKERSHMSDDPEYEEAEGSDDGQEQECSDPESSVWQVLLNQQSMQHVQDSLAECRQMQIACENSRSQQEQNSPSLQPEHNVLSGYHTGSSSDAAVCHVSPKNRHEQIVEPGIRLQADEAQPVENQSQILSVRCAWCAYQFLGQLTQRERLIARAEFFAQHSQCRYRQQLRQVTPRHVQNHNVLSGYHQDSSRSAAVCHVSPRSRHEQIDERIEESGSASQGFGSLTLQRLECTWCGDVHFNRYRSKDRHVQRAFNEKHYRCRYRLQHRRNTPQHVPDYNELSGYHTGSGSDAAVCHVSPVSRHEQQSMKSDSPRKKPRLGTDEIDQLTPNTMPVDPKRSFSDKDFSDVFHVAKADDLRLEYTFRQLRVSTNAASVQDQHAINNLAAHTPMFNQVTAGTSQYCQALPEPGGRGLLDDNSVGLAEAIVQAKEGMSVILYCAKMLFILSHVKAVRHSHVGMSLKEIRTLLPTDLEQGVPLAEGAGNSAPNCSREPVTAADAAHYVERFNQIFSDHPTVISNAAVPSSGYAPYVGQDLIDNIKRALENMTSLGNERQVSVPKAQLIDCLDHIKHGIEELDDEDCRQQFTINCFHNLYVEVEIIMTSSWRMVMGILSQIRPAELDRFQIQGNCLTEHQLFRDLPMCWLRDDPTLRTEWHRVIDLLFVTITTIVTQLGDLICTVGWRDPCHLEVMSPVANVIVRLVDQLKLNTEYMILKSQCHGLAPGGDGYMARQIRSTILADTNSLFLNERERWLDSNMRQIYCKYVAIHPAVVDHPNWQFAVRCLMQSVFVEMNDKDVLDFVQVTGKTTDTSIHQPWIRQNNEPVKVIQVDNALDKSSDRTVAERDNDSDTAWQQTLLISELLRLEEDVTRVKLRSSYWEGECPELIQRMPPFNTNGRVFHPGQTESVVSTQGGGTTV